jgi:hypothetical protein
MKPQWKVTTTQIEQLRIVGPYAEGKDCLTWLYENGYYPTRSGPYTDKEMFPKVDVKRFLITAEREAI